MQQKNLQSEDKNEDKIQVQLLSSPLDQVGEEVDLQVIKSSSSINQDENLENF